MGAILLAGLGATPERGAGVELMVESAGAAGLDVAWIFRWVFVAADVFLVLALLAIVLMEERPLRGPAAKAPPVCAGSAAGAGGVGLLLAAHDVVVGGRLAQEAALDHPVDLLLELGRLVAGHAAKLRQQPVLALLGREIAQQLVARTLLVLAQPRDRAVERAAQLGGGLLVDVGAGDDAAAPAQIGDLAAAGRGGARRPAAPSTPQPRSRPLSSASSRSLACTSLISSNGTPAASITSIAA